MLVYERIQTIIGREVYGEEVRILAAVFGVRTDFFFTEESTEPWKVEPEPEKYTFEIEDNELNEKIFDRADKLGVSPDELVSRVILEYIVHKKSKGGMLV